MTEEEERQIAEANRLLERKRRELGRQNHASSIGDLLSGFTAQPNAVAQPAKKSNLEFARYVGSLKTKQRRICVIPGPIVDEFGDLSERCMRTLIGLHYYRDKDTNISRPGMKTLVKVLGRNAKYYQRGIKELKQKGFILQVNKSGYGRASEYYLAVNKSQMMAIREWNQPNLVDT